MNRNVMFIFNPKAGKGKVKNSLFSIINGFFKMGDFVTMFPTQHRNHAIELIHAYANNYDLIICSGGDGTINEVICGVMERKIKIPIAYIPTGTVNDFANTLGLSSNIKTALQSFAQNHLFACDICRFNKRYFTYVAAFGAFTGVAYSTPQASKNIFGKAAYFLEGMKQLNHIKTYAMKLTYEDRILEDRFAFGAITNAKYVGGFQSASTKNAKMDDGKFEVLLIRMPQNPFDLQLIITALLKQEVNEKFMEFFTTDELHIHCEEDVIWTLDGEEGDSIQDIHIRIYPKAVSFLV